MPKTKSDEESFNGAPSSRYSRITQHTKDKLCYIVTTTSLKVKSAAKILKINSSTAKMIIKKFYQMPIEEQQKILERGAKSKKEKSKATIKQGSTSQTQQLKKQMLENSNHDELNQEKQVLVKSQQKAEQDLASKKNVGQKQEHTSHNQCLYYYCPIYNFYPL